MNTIALLYDSVFNFGGVENHVLSLLNKRDSSRYSFVVISDMCPSFQTKLEAFNVDFVRFQSGHPLNPFLPIRLARVLRRKKIDLVHAHSPTASLWGRIAAFLSNVPFVATVHLPVDKYHGELDTARSRFGLRVYTYLDRWLNRRKGLTGKLIYVAEHIHRRDVRKGHSLAENSVMIPNGVDVSQFANIDREKARSQFDLKSETKGLVFVGRLEAQKGPQLLIRAFAEIQVPEVDICLWLIGEGTLREALERQVEGLGLTESVRFWGYQEDIGPFLKASDIFVLPSAYEGMPYALLEAMAAGLPCVVTAVGDNNRLVQDGEHGLVIPPGNVNLLSEALTRLLGDPTVCLQMSEAVQKQACQFSDEVMVRRIEKVYNDCLKSL